MFFNGFENLKTMDIRLFFQAGRNRCQNRRTFWWALFSLIFAQKNHFSETSFPNDSSQESCMSESWKRPPRWRSSARCAWQGVHWPAPSSCMCTPVLCACTSLALYQYICAHVSCACISLAMYKFICYVWIHMYTCIMCLCITRYVWIHMYICIMCLWVSRYVSIQLWSWIMRMHMTRYVWNAGTWCIYGYIASTWLYEHVQYSAVCVCVCVCVCVHVCVHVCVCVRVHV